ncbi:MAG: radical SAM protein [Deltaproteobacteria bacterium]|nr:radical SAM protein [Deltaproteobacteria bacterium]
MTRPLRLRPERFGAIVSLQDPPALVSVDRVLARRLGVDPGGLWEQRSDGVDVDPLSAPTEVHLAVTERCGQGCPGCYADASPDGDEPSFSALVAQLERLAELGVFSVTFGGGEASLRADVFALAERARALGLVPTVTTSGAGVSAGRASRFRVFAQVNVSWDGPKPGLATVRTHESAAIAELAMARLRAAGVRFGVNFVLTRTSFAGLEELAKAAEVAGAVELQLLRLVPGGRGSAMWQSQRLRSAQVDRLGPALMKLVETRELSVRVNCAMLPLLSSAGLAPDELRRFGVLGCEAGRSLMTVDVHGRVSPCSYSHRGGQLLSVDAWSVDEALRAHRAHALSPPEPCASCDLRRACRGGCRVVARHATGDFDGLDPECPRVREFSSAQAPKESTSPSSASTM